MNKKKMILYGGCVVLLILLYVIVSAGFHHKKRYLQMQVESEFPGKNGQSGTEKIRVLLKTNGFLQIAHSEVKLQSESGLKISWKNPEGESGEDTENVLSTETEPGQMLVITPSDSRFEAGSIKIANKKEGEKITLAHLNRGYGTPSY